MPTLETFRKQAKQLVRWHRDGNYSIGSRIRGLPRYKHLTDAQALKLKFPLSEAQEIIAIEAGFESWAALKSATSGATPTSNARASGAAIKAAIPVVFVSNVSNVATFFRDKLGFSIEFLHGNPAFYGCVSRDGAALHLRFVHEPVIAPHVREKESLISAFIAVENIKALFEEYKANDVPFVSTLRKEPWGGPTFTVRDPDGNAICFSAG
jgi:catechol 2,3-dioxygenase-like lactoylglutathione lyase family enzyme